MSYGMPYMGSKSQIAEALIEVLPHGKRFVDLFGGGGAMSHCAALSGKYESVLYNELNSVVARLNTMKATNPNVIISLYGYTEWLMYTKVYTELFHKYDTYIPTTSYYNAHSKSVQSLEQNFHRWFKTDMQLAIPRFAITGYDHAQFFLRGMHQHGASFKGTKGESTYIPLQTPLKFKPVGDVGGGMQNSVFMLIHYKPNLSIEAVNY